jgi:spore coat protein H
MNIEHGLLGAVMTALLVAACADTARDGNDLSGDDLIEAAALAREEANPAHPEGWGTASHDPSAEPDYARLFPHDRVQRIDLEFPPEIEARLYDDLTQRIGAPSAGSSGFGGFGGFGGTSPAGLAACAGKVRNEPCSFLGLRGTCGTNAPFVPPNLGGGSRAPDASVDEASSAPRGNSSGSALVCRESELGGALDMVPGDPVAVPVTVRYDGHVWNHVAMRFKGNSSLMAPWRTGVRKLGLRLDFDKFEGDHPEIKNQRFFGFSKLVFNPAYQDTALIREKLAADLLRESGLPAASTAFYRVFVRVGDTAVYWGLYTMLEDPADVLPRTRFADGSGNVYKPDGNGADFTHLDKVGFEKKSNGKTGDYGDIERAIAALHAPRDNAARWRANLEATFDVEGFLRTLAFSRAIDHFDSYGTFAHNYYLYGDPSRDGRLAWISWDHNLTWSAGFFPFARVGVMMDEVGKQWPLVRFLLDDPTYRAKYRDALTAFLDGPYAKDTFEARAKRLHALIAPYVVGAEGERAPYTNLRNPESFHNSLSALLAAADARRTAVAAALAKEREANSVGENVAAQ